MSSRRRRPAKTRRREVALLAAVVAVVAVGALVPVLRTLPYVERYAWFSLATPDEGGDGTGLYRPDGTRTAAGDAYRTAA